MHQLTDSAKDGVPTSTATVSLAPESHRQGWRLKRAAQREDGQAAWEFVLLLPFLIMFFLLFVDLGILMYEYVAVSNATREGARYASTTCPSSSPPGCGAAEVRIRTAERSAGFLKVSPTPQCGTAPASATAADEICVNWVIPTTTTNRKDRGDAVVVRANHMYDFIFFPFQVRVVACADMRLETKDTTAYDGSGPTKCTP